MITRVPEKILGLDLPEWLRNFVLDDKIYPTDEAKAKFAIELARQNVKSDTGGPFGAAVFDGNHALIGLGVNLVVAQNCSAAHAEILAFSSAQQTIKNFDLSACASRPCTLATSAQPCVQCFGALWWSGIERLIISARASDTESLTGFCEGPFPENWIDLLQHRDSLPPVQTITDVLRDEAREVLKLYRERGGRIYNAGAGRANT